jgi:cytochrome b involved in lipid metabolism
LAWSRRHSRDDRVIPSRSSCFAALVKKLRDYFVYPYGDDNEDTFIMRKLLLIAAFLAAGTAQAQLSSFTLADVAQHATAADCWMILNTNKVYNLTPFISMHPGGSGMASYCGKDGTAAFGNVGHSSNAVALETPYLTGNLVTAPLPIVVSITPTNSTTKVGSTVQFTPKVTNSTSGVAWTVVPSTLGTISASGLFTAVTVGGGTVTAASMQDMTKSASATVTVSTTTPPTPKTITVAITPSALTVNEGSKMQFRATLTNSTSGVSWSTAGSIGTVDSSGVFTAGLTTGTGTVTATSVDDPTKVAVAQVTISAVNCTGQNDDDHHGSGHHHDD